MTAVDPDAVTRATLSCPGVAGMSSGPVGEVASYLPGRRVPGVRVTDEGVEVHVVARWDQVLPALAEAVRTAVSAIAPGRRVSVFIDDVELPDATAVA